MKKQDYVLDFLVTCLSSIVHGGETEGTTMRLRRMHIIQPNGESELIPVISGNAIRGILRDIGAITLLERMQEKVPELRLHPAAFGLLFSGGALSKDSAKQVDMEEIKRITSCLPFISLFGGATGSQIIDGHMLCGAMYPIIQETKHIIPPQILQDIPDNLPGVADIVEIVDYTRRDDRKRRDIRSYIEGLSEPKKDEDPVQKRYSQETIIAGTRLWWRVILHRVTDIELGVFLDTLIQWQKRPHVGGRSSVGHGQLRIENKQIGIIDVQPMIADEYESKVKLYQDYISEHTQEMVETLVDIK